MSPQITQLLTKIRQVAEKEVAEIATESSLEPPTTGAHLKCEQRRLNEMFSRQDQAYEMDIYVKTTLNQIIKQHVPLEICTDSKSIYDCLVKLGTTKEKLLMIDVMCLRNAFEMKDIDYLTWIEGNNNPTDAMTKSNANGALKDLIDSNTYEIKANA